MIKKLKRQARAAFHVLRYEGLNGFARKLKAKVLGRGGQIVNTAQTQEIYTKARAEDIFASAEERLIQKSKGKAGDSLHVAWIMPPPGPGSGGHMNIYRFIQFLEKAGHTCEILLYGQTVGGSVSEILEITKDSYPKVNAPMKWIKGPDDIPVCDAAIATAWETAYPLKSAEKVQAKLYFVQDFEPYFYPKGGLYALAENTYRFGFTGVTAGGWLEKKLKEEYNMDTAAFDFGSDSGRYFVKNDKPRKEIFYYARPYTERRGFEIGMLALELFHEKHPEYTINLAGSDVSEYTISFPYNNLKTLPLSALNDVYNRCAAGLVLSFTNMSLLPLELLGSGVIPVVNDAENNRLVSDNPFIAYTEATPAALAETLSAVVTRVDLPSYAKEASKSVKTATWEQSGQKFVDIVEKAVLNHG